MRSDRGSIVLSSLLTLFILSGCTADDSSDPDVHPRMRLTAAELNILTEAMPAEVRSAVASRPQYFVELLHRVLSGPEELVWLVDKAHSLEDSYEPDDLVVLDDYRISVNRRGLRLRRAVMPDLLAMAEAARAAGLELVLSSAYRSYEYQATVYARNVEQLGQEEADRESARPGTSQHQLGTTVDFGSITDAFAFTGEGRWLAEHAWEYGFSLSYPDGAEGRTGYRYESWHYRYIGRDASRLEREFFGGSQQEMLEFLNDNGSHLHALLK